MRKIQLLHGKTKYDRCDQFPFCFQIIIYLTLCLSLFTIFSMEEVKEEKPIGNQQVQGEDRHGDTACKIRSLPSRHRHGSVIWYQSSLLF